MAGQQHAALAPAPRETHALSQGGTIITRRNQLQTAAMDEVD
jgi:hypothetical protein